MVLIRPPEFSKTKVFGRRPGRVEQSHSIKSQFKINNLPVSTKMTRGTIELPSISETFHGGIIPNKR